MGANKIVQETRQRALVRLANPKKLTPVSASQAVAAAGTAEPFLPYAITGVDQGNKTFTITGDKTSEAELEVDDTFTVISSTGNDGTYTVVSATYSAPSLSIVVAEAIPDATVDGEIVAQVMVTMIIVQSKKGNTNDIFIGGSNVTSSNGRAFSKREIEVIDAPSTKYYFDLNEFYVDVTTNGEGIVFDYFQE